MPHKLRFHVNRGKARLVEGTLSLNGSVHEFIGDSHFLQRLLGDIGAFEGQPSEVVFSADRATSSDNVTSRADVYDSVGASTFVIAVVLVYGISIVFLISSHVFMKKKTAADAEKSIDLYLRQADELKDKSRREEYARLKHSLIPVIVKSARGREMLRKGARYAPYLTRHATVAACGRHMEGFHPEEHQQDKTTHRADLHGYDGVGPERSAGQSGDRKPDEHRTGVSPRHEESLALTGTQRHQPSQCRHPKSERNNRHQSVVTFKEEHAVPREDRPTSVSEDECSVYYSAQSLQHV